MLHNNRRGMEGELLLLNSELRAAMEEIRSLRKENGYLKEENDQLRGKLESRSNLPVEVTVQPLPRDSNLPESNKAEQPGGEGCEGSASSEVEEDDVPPTHSGVLDEWYAVPQCMSGPPSPL